MRPNITSLSTGPIDMNYHWPRIYKIMCVTPTNHGCPRLRQNNIARGSNKLLSPRLLQIPLAMTFTNYHRPQLLLNNVCHGSYKMASAAAPTTNNLLSLQQKTISRLTNELLLAAAPVKCHWPRLL